MRRYIFIIFLLSAMPLFGLAQEQSVREFIRMELLHYPQARLVDIYKNYFQDAYGPGHLIPDTTQAGAYLDWELKQPYWVDSLLCQPLGIHHDYYRVNLKLVKDGLIPRDTLIAGMIESAPLARKPAIDEWIQEWNEVLQVIEEMKLHVPKMNADKRRIRKTLQHGQVVMHHSKCYENLYHPHYRIIHRTVFARWTGRYFSVDPIS